MPKVKLAVGGRAYEIVCGEGQEERVRQMGEAVDGALTGIPISERANDAQRLLLAALSLADGRDEAQAKRAQLAEKVMGLEQQYNELREQQENTGTQNQEAEQRAAGLAQQVEHLQRECAELREKQEQASALSAEETQKQADELSALREALQAAEAALASTAGRIETLAGSMEEENAPKHG